MIRRAALLVLAATLAPAVAPAQAVPTQQQLGVPAYPGAQYDARNSQGMSQPTEKYYLFTTADSVARVVRFYENATHRKGAQFGNPGAVIIVLEGEAPFPTHGIVIEPNRQGMYPAAVRTIITIRREVPEPGGQ
jgi:hypothetical protein